MQPRSAANGTSCPLSFGNGKLLFPVPGDKRTKVLLLFQYASKDNRKFPLHSGDEPIGSRVRRPGTLPPNIFQPPPHTPQKREGPTAASIRCIITSRNNRCTRRTSLTGTTVLMPANTVRHPNGNT